MKTLTILKTLALIYVIAKPYILRLEFRWNRTFWEKRIIGFDILLWDAQFGSAYSKNGKSILSWTCGDR